MAEAKSFAVAMMETFKKPGQNTQEFLAEFKQLTPEDKAWYRAELIKTGYTFSA